MDKYKVRYEDVKNDVSNFEKSVTQSAYRIFVLQINN